ncbi:MAG: Holliday junction branch migration DNA helicase RuvB, partial [Selenomonadaceae bacterium]|nr:Holliday junction branch migration DNA helicase RuvB [Selenomonadaceae bacterium]
LVEIITRAAQILKIPIELGGAEEIAGRSRGTPRIANRLLKRVRDFAQVDGSAVITDEIADRALLALEVDRVGLDHTDRRMLDAMIKKFRGGPVGLETIAAAISETRETIEDIYEPYLLQLGFIMRTPRGRVVTEAGYAHMGAAYPKLNDSPSLFDFEEG